MAYNQPVRSHGDDGSFQMQVRAKTVIEIDFVHIKKRGVTVAH